MPAAGWGAAFTAFFVVLKSQERGESWVELTGYGCAGAAMTVAGTGFWVWRGRQASRRYGI